MENKTIYDEFVDLGWALLKATTKADYYKVVKDIETLNNKVCFSETYKEPKNVQENVIDRLIDMIANKSLEMFNQIAICERAMNEYDYSEQSKWYKIKVLKQSLLNAVKREDYETAKEIKNQIELIGGDDI